MNSEKSILGKCFQSSSKLWETFLNDDENLNILYYPSAGTDLRPFVFSKNECLEFIGLAIDENKYFEPNFFIFSDYFPFPNSTFFDTKYLHTDNYTSITIVEYCEIVPTKEYEFIFNEANVVFRRSAATGKAIFFKAEIYSHVLKDCFYRYAIYFFYENVNLINQLFLRNQLTISHIVWKRDGSGLGGGVIYHNFLYPVSYILQTKFYFIWDHYLNEDTAELNEKNVTNEKFPNEIVSYIPKDFSIKLTKKKLLTWEKDEKMNLYFRE